MKKVMTFFLVAAIMAACSTNKVTGRKQLSLVPESELQMMASQEYDAFLKENQVISPSSSQEAAMVQRVGLRIANAITEYYRGIGKSEVIKGYDWEFNLIDSKDINAWAMPGGKVVVYTGLLPVTQTEDALAVVVGHEIAHAIAQHGNERMSQQLVQQLGGVALQIALAKQPQQTQEIFMTSYGIGTTVGAILPFSRKEELEADKFGLFFSAMAGYDPQVAIPFWERMANSGGTKPPEFLSTHPADQTRIKKLQEIMPEAMQYYNNSSKVAKSGSGTGTTGTKMKVKKIKM